MYPSDANEGLEWCYGLNQEYDLQAAGWTNETVCLNDFNLNPNFDSSFRGVVPECNNGVCYLFNGTYNDKVSLSV